MDMLSRVQKMKKHRFLSNLKKNIENAINPTCLSVSVSYDVNYTYDTSKPFKITFAICVQKDKFSGGTFAASGCGKTVKGALKEIVNGVNYFYDCNLNIY